MRILPGDRPARRHRPRRTALAVVAAAALVLATGVGLPGRAVAGKAPGAIPDATVDGMIHADQIELVTQRPLAAVRAAQAARAAAVRTLTAGRAAEFRAEQVSVDAVGVRSRATAVVTAATAGLVTARTARLRAAAATALQRRRLRGLALAWYTGGESVTTSAAAPLATDQAAIDADTELRILTRITSSTLGRDTAHLAVAVTRQAAATTTLGGARTILAADIHDAEHAAADLTAAERTVAAEQASVRARTTVLDAAVTAEAAAVKTLDGPEGRHPRPVPTILGTSALTAAQIVRWFTDMGYVAGTRVGVVQLAALYISEGRAEGVRGDIAFAQAIVETGGFDSPDAIRLNNYAGIGHCDACDGGLRFASPLAGVRSQIQLLRTYADATLTTAQLAAPPPIATLAPQDESVRGCCRTWNALTGVWATDTHYGATVLDVYAEMLASAVPPASGPTTPSTDAGG